MKIAVIVTLNIEGLHYWEQCPYKDVDFLRYPHRHLFYIKIYKKVIHTDRQIEIIRLKREVIIFLRNKFGNPANFGNRSCEDIAVELIKQFNLQKCEVLEDNENGAEVQI